MHYQIRQIDDKFVAFYTKGSKFWGTEEWKAVTVTGTQYHICKFNNVDAAMVALRAIHQSDLPDHWSEFNICKVVKEGKL